MKNAISVSHNDVMVRKLRKSRSFTLEYLKGAMEESDELETLLIAFRQTAETLGGVYRIAKKAGIQRESLYRALSPRGNPRFSTLLVVARAMGLTLTVERTNAVRKHAKCPHNTLQGDGSPWAN